MPELPEVEAARRVVDGRGLDRRIVDVDDSDTYVCRPHHPGEIRAALVGRRLTAVHRQGKSMWCDTSPAGRSRDPGPVLGIHLGTSGRIVVGDGHGDEFEGGDPHPEPRAGARRGASNTRARETGDEFARFRLTFDDHGYLVLIDPRRLGRIRLDPPVEDLGPDAAQVTADQFRSIVASGSAPVKGRLLDQAAVAGIGNILADQSLWQARLDPARRTGDLSPSDVTRLHRAVRESIDTAIDKGGVHTLPVVAARTAGATCPRCGTGMAQGTVAGRTTWWCPREQT